MDRTSYTQCEPVPGMAVLKSERQRQRQAGKLPRPCHYHCHANRLPDTVGCWLACHADGTGSVGIGKRAERNAEVKPRWAVGTWILERDRKAEMKPKTATETVTRQSQTAHMHSGTMAGYPLHFPVGQPLPQPAQRANVEVRGWLLCFPKPALLLPIICCMLLPHVHMGCVCC